MLVFSFSVFFTKWCEHMARTSLGHKIWREKTSDGEEPRWFIEMSFNSKGEPGVKASLSQLLTCNPLSPHLCLMSALWVIDWNASGKRSILLISGISSWWTLFSEIKFVSVCGLRVLANHVLKQTAISHPESSVRANVKWWDSSVPGNRVSVLTLT